MSSRESGSRSRRPSAPDRRASSWVDRGGVLLDDGRRPEEAAQGDEPAVFELNRKLIDPTGDFYDLTIAQERKLGRDRIKFRHRPILVLVTAAETLAQIGRSRDQHSKTRANLDKFIAGLPGTISGHLGEAALFGATSPEEEGTRFVSVRLDFVTGRVAQAERVKGLRQFDGTRLLTDKFKARDHRVTVGATENHGLAIAMESGLNKALAAREEPIAVQFANMEIVERALGQRRP